MSVNNRDIELIPASNTTKSSDCRSSDFTTQTGSAQVTRLNLSNSSVIEEDIDPFTYHPPFTKWDYLKVCNIVLYIKCICV